MASPFYPDSMAEVKAMSSPTKRYWLTHNETGVRLCGWKKPRQK